MKKILYIIVALIVVASAVYFFTHYRIMPAKPYEGGMSTEDAIADAGALVLVSIFYPGPGGQLETTTRWVYQVDNWVERSALLVNEFLKYHRQNDYFQIAPRVRLDHLFYAKPSGVLYLDFSGDILLPNGGALDEYHFLLCLMATLHHHLPFVQAVQFLKNAEPMDTLNGHITAQQPLEIDTFLHNWRNQ